MSTKPISLTSVEAEIMDVVWKEDGPITVRDVYEELRLKKRVAYTTVMSVMKKLAAKGFLTQDKNQTAYLYAATETREEVASKIINSVIEKLLGGDEAKAKEILASKGVPKKPQKTKAKK